MLRIRTGARDGLRGGAFGFVAAVFTLSAQTTTSAAPYADIVVDANSGAVLHASSPDALRHPASLTKIMTLYLLFEQLEAGKLKLDSQLDVSEAAAEQSPTKLGLRAGSTIKVEDAIKGIITRSANDAAVVVGEAIAGSESAFAKLMTRKAHALGMSRTVYRNASGLPDDEQVTTAREQAILGRAIQERFPRYYKYFSTRSFSFRGQSISNHNRLLGRVEGVDGIKTGYIRASGFNLVTSVNRGNRSLVAVVMGGSSASSRDAKMRDLISEKIAKASTKRTAPMIAEAAEPSDGKVAIKVATRQEAGSASKREGKSEGKAEARTSGKGEPRYALASAHNVPVRPTPTSEPVTAAGERAPQAAARVVPGSTEPIRPVPVRTLTVRAGTQTASLMPTLIPPGVNAEPPLVVVTTPARASPPIPAVKTEPARPVPPEVPASTLPAQPAELPAPPVAVPPAKLQSAVAVAATPPRMSAAKAEPTKVGAEAVASPPLAQPSQAPAAQPTAAPVAVAAAPAARPQPRNGWMIQVGAFPAEQEAKQRLSIVQNKASKMLNHADPFTESVDKGGTTLYRARFAGFDKDAAEAACKYLKRNDVDCLTVKN